MHVNPAQADVERLLARLTMAQGIGMAWSILFNWPSPFVGALGGYGAIWVWIVLFSTFGLALEVASAMWHVRTRVWLLMAVGGLWLSFAIVFLQRRMPVALLTAAAIVSACAVCARRLWVRR